MHDGSIATLEGVIDHYAARGRVAGPLKSEFVPGFVITEQEKADVVAFLKSLTDEEFLTSPKYADPFKQSESTGDQDNSLQVSAELARHRKSKS
jgi:cytochrome c peroxidase